MMYEWAMILRLSLTPQQERQLSLLTQPSEIGRWPSEHPLLGTIEYRLVFTYPVQNGAEDKKAFQWLSRIYDEYAHFDVIDYMVIYRLKRD